jgi:hypothetical protein
MSSILPSVTTTIGSVIQTTIPASLPLAKEYAWDFDNNNFLLLDGKHQAVTGAAAVKVWIWKCLKTPKNAFKAYDGNFGNDIETLYGQGLSVAAQKSEIERYLKEALLVNAYITGISDISISVEGSQTIFSFTAVTIYGEVSVSGV